MQMKSVQISQCGMCCCFAGACVRTTKVYNSETAKSSMSEYGRANVNHTFVLLVPEFNLYGKVIRVIRICYCMNNK